MAEPTATLQGHPLSGQHLLLCVCGGIAAYKSAELVRRLRDAGAEVQVAMTENAQRFVGAQTFQALSGHTVRTSDRKSTRLNSSHLVISYAVFCLKKKKIQ